jgi:plasmid stabilization system protein ParE
MLRYAFHPGATDDLAEIVEYIAPLSPIAANRLVDEILDKIDRLVDHPYQGFTRPNLTSRPLRFIVVREYLIAYAPEQQPLWVIALFHGRRNPRVMASILRGRE